VKIQFPLLPWQGKAREVRAKRPLVVVNGGVHTGKTVWAAMELLADMVAHPGEVFWWVAGQRFQLEAMWNALLPSLQQLNARIKQHPLLQAQLGNGARVYGVSAENLDAIASHHPRAIYGDEAAKWRPKAYQLVRLRLLGQVKTRGLFLSTPRPNFWRELVRWGREERDGRWGLVHVTTPEARLVSPEDIEAIRRDLPEELFRQEIMADVLEGSGNVFRRVAEAATGRPEGPIGYGRYVIGYDPAKLQDFAVVLVRYDDKVVWVERWARVDYTEQAKLVAAISRRYGGAKVVIDAGGPGEAAAELLERERVSIERVVFDNRTKEEMVNRVMVRFEQGRITIPHGSCGAAFQALKDELTAYERGRTDAGLRYTYSAPEGEHDDCVTALLLAFGREPHGPAASVVAVIRNPFGRRYKASWIPTYDDGYY
jgi:hypothetical protein